MTTMRLAIILTLGGLLVLPVGCGGRHAPPTTQPHIATDIPAEQVKVSYWLAQPAANTVNDSNYDRLYDACEHVVRQHRFEVDRHDYRSGLLSTRPLISKQFWEPWRSDVGSGGQLVASSLATYRRTIQWTIERHGEGFAASPRVVVERFAGDDRRLTTVVHYNSALSGAEAQTSLPSPTLGRVPASSWYAVGRDEPLEAKLAEEVQKRLARN